MDSKTRALFEARANIIKAMAHPTRLFMVDILSGGKKCVRELTELVGHDMSTVSKHLAILKNAGIVRDERQGQQIYYHLKIPCVLNFFKCVETVIETTAREQLHVIE
nr:winged helix-turn-helix transcriptional regulator [candidate division Zixibacteria bacterium]